MRGQPAAEGPLKASITLRARVDQTVFFRQLPVWTNYFLMDWMSSYYPEALAEE
jgi:hypothetical protein